MSKLSSYSLVNVFPGAQKISSTERKYDLTVAKKIYVCAVVDAEPTKVRGHAA
jgi:hypothetical protein